MDFDLKTIFSVLVAVLMIGSIVGFTAFYNFPEQQQGNGGEERPVQPPTSIDFVANDVNATIFQMLPSMSIQGETRETDLSKITSRIYAIEGVKRASSRFEQSPYTMLGTGFVYIAEISFAPDSNVESMLERLESETDLQYITGYTFALIELPKSISMKSKDVALNLSRDYTFAEDITEALVNFGAMEGDRLNVSVSATFVGEDATNIIAYENENLTAKPVQKKAGFEAEIASLENRLLFSAEIGYSRIGDAALLEPGANAIAGVTGTSFSIPVVGASLSIESNAALGDENFALLEQFIQNLNAEPAVGNSPLGGKASFPEGIGSQEFLEKKLAIEGLIAALGLEAMVKEETGTMSGQLNLEGKESSQAASSLSRLLEPIASEYEIFQPGNVSVGEIFDADLNASYAVPDGKIQGLFFPGHAPGGLVQAEVDYTLVRGSIASAFATEKKP